MFASQINLLFLPGRNLCFLMRRRPITCLVCGLCLFVMAGGAAWYFWPIVYFWEAQRALSLDLLPEATAAINSYLEHKPNDPEGHLLASRIDRLRDRYDDAEKHLDEYKRIEGSTEGSQLEWVLLRAMGGELPEVESGLHYSLEKNDPHSDLILEALIYCYLKECRYQTARYYLEKWLKKEPDNVRALSWRGWVREILDFKEEAKEDYIRVLQLSPKHQDTRIRYVHALLNDKNFPEALEHLKILERDHPDHAEVKYALAVCRANYGETEEAAKLLDELLVMQPNNARALHERGRLIQAPLQQEKWFRQAIQIDPSFIEARYSLWNCLKTQNRSAEAESEKKKYDETVANWIKLKNIFDLLEKAPGNPDLLAEAGNLLLLRNSVVGQGFLYKALMISPNHKLAQEYLAKHHEKTGKKAPPRKTVPRSPN